MISGSDVLQIAKAHFGEKYVLGARAPMANSNYKGPWDCAEYCSWCVYQASGILFGVRPTSDPMRADAYTGYWAQQSGDADCRIPLEDAFVTPGSLLLRAPATGRGGHIAFSDGRGKTMEARGARYGVGAFGALNRRWDYGILVPGIRYFVRDRTIDLEPAPFTLRVTQPLMRGSRVRKAQKALAKLGYAVGDIDGIYGPQTESAVIAFQSDNGIVADGEIGRRTLKILKKLSG